MLDVLEYKKHSIYYSCACGTKGVCLIRPLGNEDAVVLELTCAHCHTSRRIILLADESKMSKDTDYGAAIIIKNKVQERTA